MSTAAMGRGSREGARSWLVIGIVTIVMADQLLSCGGPCDSSFSPQQYYLPFAAAQRKLGVDIRYHRYGDYIQNQDLGLEPKKGCETIDSVALTAAEIGSVLSKLPALQFAVANEAAFVNSADWQTLYVTYSMDGHTVVDSFRIVDTNMVTWPTYAQIIGETTP